MYLALVKVFNRHVPSYILKFSAVGWGKLADNGVTNQCTLNKRFDLLPF